MKLDDSSEEFIPNEEPRTKSIMESLKASKTDIRLSKLEDNVDKLKDTVSSLEFKVIKRVDDLIESQTKLTNQSYLLTEKIAAVIEHFEKAIPIGVVYRIFAIVFILIGAKELIAHFTH